MQAVSTLRGLFNRRFLDNLLPVPATTQLTVGSLAPPFQLLNVVTDQPIRLSDYTGQRKGEQPETDKRPVVLAFTRIFSEKVYCPLCYPHIVALNAAYNQFLERGAEVFLITSTDQRQSKIVRRDLSLAMPVLSDPQCRVFQTYRVGQALGAPLPAQFVVDQTGRIRYHHLFSFFDPNAEVEKLLRVIDQLHA